MKNLFKYFTLFILSSFSLIACTKYTGLTTNDNNNNITPKGDTAPRIKFYQASIGNSMEVNLNNQKVGSIAQYYATSYITAKEGTNNISLNFVGKISDLNTTIELVRNTNYSCFFYKVGNEWKYNLVKDDLSKVPATNYASIRVLDFRTEAYFNYVNIRMTGPGGVAINQTNRNFLDHVTYGGYNSFTETIAGSHNFFAFTDTETTSWKYGIPIDGKGIYTVMLITTSNVSPPYSNALYYIYPYTVKHN